MCFLDSCWRRTRILLSNR